MASVFSGKAGRNAALWTEKQANWQRGENTNFIDTGYAQARSELEPSFEKASDFLSKGYEGARKDAESGFGQARTDLQAGQTGALGALGTGYGQAIGSLQKGYGEAIDTQGRAISAWDPLVQRGMAGYDMLNNALGLNGAAGTTAAQQAFQVGPGYQWNVDQATSQAQRAANKTGALYSGNTGEATERLASNLANQEYGSWLNRLQPYQAAAGQAVQGQVGSIEGLGNLQKQQGMGVAALQKDLSEQQSNVYQNVGQQLATNASNQGQFLANQGTQYGQDQASLALNQGQSLAGLDISKMQAQLGNNNQYWGTVIPAGQQGMMAGQQAAANRTGALMGGLQLGAQAIGGMMGGGGGFGSFLSGFGKG
jgi:hypothetical protein